MGGSWLHNWWVWSSQVAWDLSQQRVMMPTPAPVTLGHRKKKKKPQFKKAKELWVLSPSTLKTQTGGGSGSWWAYDLGSPGATSLHWPHAGAVAQKTSHDSVGCLFCFVLCVGFCCCCCLICDVLFKICLVFVFFFLILLFSPILFSSFLFSFFFFFLLLWLFLILSVKKPYLKE